MPSCRPGLSRVSRAVPDFSRSLLCVTMKVVPSNYVCQMMTEGLQTKKIGPLFYSLFANCFCFTIHSYIALILGTWPRSYSMRPTAKYESDKLLITRVLAIPI